MNKNLCNTRKIYTFIFLIIVLLAGISLIICTPHNSVKNSYNNKIDLKYQRIYLLPITGLEILESASYWPENKNTRKYLKEYIYQTWRTLLAEFRSYEKYGLFTMVDSNVTASIDILVEITSTEFKNDTLYIPVKIKVYSRISKKSNESLLNLYGICKMHYEQTSLKSYYCLGEALTNYQKRFPYKEIVVSVSE